MKIRFILPAIAALLALGSCTETTKPAQPINMYVGTFTREGGQGLHSMQFDTTTGAISSLQLIAPIKDPSFISLSPDKQVLYAYDDAGKDSAIIIAYKVDSATRTVTELNQVKTPTKTFCYLSLFDNGKYLGVSSYNEGTSYSFPLNADGTIVNTPSVVQHYGSSVHPRQAAPHAHSINQDPRSGHVYIPDLGLDKVIIYSLKEGQLDSVGFAQANPGEGPRHAAFHKGGNFMAIVNEISNTVTIYTRDTQGLFTQPLQSISTIPADFTGETTASDIHFSPDGNVLYASNRGHNSIAIFAFDPEIGKLESKGWITEGINFPRTFTIDPSGKFMLIANQKGRSIVVYGIGTDATQLTKTPNSIEIDEPVSIIF